MEQKVRVELTNERVAASYSADEYLPHFQGLRVITVYISLCPVYSSIITNLLIVSNLILLSKNHLLLVIYIRICRTDLLEESLGFEPRKVLPLSR